MRIKKEIEEFIRNEVQQRGREDLLREPIIGFASAQDPLFHQLKEIVIPEHLHPKDLLVEAKTVVAFFIPFSRDVVDSNRKSKEVSFQWAEAYVEANAMINEISRRLIKMLEEKGIKGATVKATHTYDQETLIATWSHRSAAFIAGLGTFGLNRMLITSVGCAGRYGSIVISEEIPADQQLQEKRCTYFNGGGCQFCINNCPTKALTPDGLDKHKCHDHLMEVNKRFTHIGVCDVCGKCVVGPCAMK